MCRKIVIKAKKCTVNQKRLRNTVLQNETRIFSIKLNSGCYDGGVSPLGILLGEYFVAMQIFFTSENK